MEQSAVIGYQKKNNGSMKFTSEYGFYLSILNSQKILYKETKLTVEQKSALCFNTGTRIVVSALAICTFILFFMLVMMITFYMFNIIMIINLNQLHNRQNLLHSV